MKLLAGIVLGLFVCPSVQAQRLVTPPHAVAGIKLGWRARTVIRTAKRKGWRLRKSERLGCRASRLTFIRGGRLIQYAGNLGVVLYRGRVYSILYLPKPNPAWTYSNRQWAAITDRWSRKYGRWQYKIFKTGPLRRAGWMVFGGKSRRFSVGVRENRIWGESRVTITSMAVWHIRSHQYVSRCLKRRKRRKRH